MKCEEVERDCYLVLRERPQRDLVAIARWTHLYPSRTQKLSILAVTIAGPAPVKITRCQVGPAYEQVFFFMFPREAIVHRTEQKHIDRIRKSAQGKKIRKYKKEIYGKRKRGIKENTKTMSNNKDISQIYI